MDKDKSVRLIMTLNRSASRLLSCFAITGNKKELAAVAHAVEFHFVLSLSLFQPKAYFFGHDLFFFLLGVVVVITTLVFFSLLFSKNTSSCPRCFNPNVWLFFVGFFYY